MALVRLHARVRLCRLEEKAKRWAQAMQRISRLQRVLVNGYFALCGAGAGAIRMENPELDRYGLINEMYTIRLESRYNPLCKVYVSKKDVSN